MIIDDFFLFGILTKLKGFKGEMHFKVENEIENSSALKEVYVLIGKHLAKYPVELLKINGDRGVLKFKDISTEQEAKELLRLEMYLPLADFPEMENQEESLLGYRVFDKTTGFLGEVSDINDDTPQILLTITKNKQEILLPLVDEFIERIDEEKKEIHVDAPAELLNLNV